MSSSTDAATVSRPAAYAAPCAASTAALPAPPVVADANADRSPYLVRRLFETPEENLFGHVKFSLVKRCIEALGLERPARVLDIGCGRRAAQGYLARLGLEVDYFGVDYEARFGPDAVVDLMGEGELLPELPWQPDVVLALDVLEHLHEDTAVLERAVRRLAASVPASARVIVTLPQMYRLDRFKLPHLHYPEHKIRLEQHEWRAVLETAFDIRRVQGLGYLSVLPYLPMASRAYAPDNALGRLFHTLRSRVFEWGPLKPLDTWLSETLGRVEAFQSISNDILFVATPRHPSDSRGRG